MKQATPKFSRQIQGLSLVELLVAMALGLFMASGALSLFAALSTADDTSENLSIIQENGRFSLGAISRDLRMAGYPPFASGADKAPFFRGTCGAFTPCTDDGADLAADRIAVWYNPPADDGTETDCTGTAVGADDYVANVYYVENETLNCRGWNTDTSSWISAAIPLVEGIDNFQVLYGQSNGVTTTSYLTASTVTDWSNISSVKLAVLVNGGANASSDSTAVTTFQLFELGEVSFQDNQMRKLYTTDVAVNNSQQQLQIF